MQLFETIAIINGVPQNLSYHYQRMIKGLFFLSDTVSNFCFDDFQKKIESAIKINSLDNKLLRCKVIYDKYLNMDIQFFCYTPKTIKTFKIICADIEYSYKYLDRTQLDNLLLKKGVCDEIIIVKNNCISDCTIGNLLLLKNNCWYTPDTPLLKGTQRQLLLDNNCIYKKTITLDTIFTFEKIMMINALNAFDKNRALDIKNSVFG